MAKKSPKKSKRKPPQKRATKRKYSDNPVYVKNSRGIPIKLSEREAAGGGIFSGYKKVRKTVRKVTRDPLDRLGISRRKFMKTRLGRRLLELSAKQLERDYGLLDDLIDRFKETRS